MADFTPFSLSSLDHTLLSVYIPQNLCFRTADHEQCLSRLQAGINLLMARLPFLTGEIVPRTDHDGAKPGELRIQPGKSSDGMMAIPMLTIKHFAGVILPPVLVRGSDAVKTDDRATVASLDSQFFPLPPILPPEQPRPVMRMQANVVADGVILSMAFSHSVFDGTGTGRVHELLAECCRAAATERPVFLPTDGKEEAALRNRLTTAGEGGHPKIDHSGEIGQSYAYESKESEANTEDSKQLLAADLLMRAFIFSPERLERLRKACSVLLPLLTHLYNQKVEDSTTRTKWPTFLSSNDVLTAVLGVCVERTRGKGGVDVSSPTRNLTFAVNFRRRLAGLPDHYLGNAVMPSRVYFRLPVDEQPGLLDSLENSIDLHPLQGSGIDARGLLEIANLAFQSRAGILAIDDAFLRSWMAFLTGQPDYGSMNLRYGVMVVTSWRDLMINSLDFGPGLGEVENFEFNFGVADGTREQAGVLEEIRRPRLMFIELGLESPTHFNSIRTSIPSPQTSFHQLTKSHIQEPNKSEDSMRFTSSTLSKVAAATATLDQYLTTLKATQLKALARATGIPSSGRKDVLRKRIGEDVSMSVFLRHDPQHGDAGKKELSVLSIDMGIQNLAVAHLVVRDGLSASSSSSSSSSSSLGQPGSVMLNAWHRIGVQELTRRHQQGKISKDPESEEEEPLQFILPAAAFRTFSTTQTQKSTDEKSNIPKGIETVEGKINFDPESLSLSAFILLSALLKAYKPTHILIERQRFRSGGQRAVLEWSLRVGVFEGMVHAVLRTMREIECYADADGLQVYGISPARVMQFWDNDNDSRDETVQKNAKSVKKLKMDIIGELLMSSSSTSRSKQEADSRISALSSWGFDVNTATTQKVVDAYLARWNGSNGKKRTKDGSDKNQDRIEKMDDLADCLLQGLTWLEWQARRARVIGDFTSSISRRV
ncbi:hypothetical protein UA08_05664 [Talaromyces atroroseus]|uniref:SAP domain-containing protein n=1 Tax=Talaromyces atroroseus TaxID=1441469 RepID=A0A225ADE0_TALAT|nr:hypothetical protein UA08_05664 [Talaromyces atroroseus]OKL59181.1 hypothetical protein UA08_05664 [Talaromyces atroroseus]